MPRDHYALAILGGAWLLALFYGFPGMMSTDSVVQLVQARGLEPIGDGNPPLMSMIWRYIDRVISGPFGMLVLQTGTFLFGLDAILRRMFTPRLSAVLAGAVLLFPPVLAPMGVIWKDSQMAGFLLAGTALLLARHRGWRIAGCVLLSVATAVRYNAVAATLPIIVLVFEWKWQGWRRYVLATAVWLAVTIAAFGANRAFTEREMHLWHSSLALADLVGTVRYSDWRTDEELEQVLEGTPLAVHDDIHKWFRWWYWPRRHWEASHGPKRLFDPPATQQQRDAVGAAWWRVVTSQPIAYLKHRWRVYEHLLGIPRETMAPVWDRRVETPFQARLTNVTTRHSWLQNAWLDAHDALASTFLFVPRFYLLLAFALLAFCRSRLVLAILASGLCYELALFFIAPSPDFRYSHWLVVTCLVAAIMLFVSRWQQGRQRTGAT